MPPIPNVSSGYFTAGLPRGIKSRPVPKLVSSYCSTDKIFSPCSPDIWPNISMVIGSMQHRAEKYTTDVKTALNAIPPAFVALEIDVPMCQEAD